MLETFTVYFDPTDYPKKWIVRRFVIGKSGPIPDAEPLIVCDLLEDVRSVIPVGLICFSRNEHDEPQIVETWL
jgi:hypothetical protein